MTIRFLQTVASETPDYPFQAGQTITVAAPSRFLLSLCDGVRAEIVKTDDERATMPAPMTPEPVRAKGRAKRVVH